MSIDMCSYGVGRRMKLAYTRRIIDAIHDGSLLEAKYEATPIFNLAVPTEVKGVPSEVLHPENSVSVPMSTLDKPF
jgi:phosphoenolpyruvate carboxykinase (ATP)